MDGGRGGDVGEGVGGAELGVGILSGVEVVDASDFGEVGCGGAVSGDRQWGGRRWLPLASWRQGSR